LEMGVPAPPSAGLGRSRVSERHATIKDPTARTARTRIFTKSRYRHRPS
jgi:hypothetical protein